MQKDEKTGHFGVFLLVTSRGKGSQEILLSMPIANRTGGNNVLQKMWKETRR